MSENHEDRAGDAPTTGAVPSTDASSTTGAAPAGDAPTTGALPAADAVPTPAVPTTAVPTTAVPAAAPAPPSAVAPPGVPVPPAYAPGSAPVPQPPAPAAYPAYVPPYAAPGAQPQPGVAGHPYPGHPAPVVAAGTARSGVRRGLVAGVAALAIALGGGVAGGFVGYSLHPDALPLQVSGVTGNGDAAPVMDRSSLASIAAELQPAIVDIRTNAGEGSGVVISADGHIVTNNHVIAGARTVTVTFNSGSQLSARVVGTDPRSDIAVVKVDATNLVPATWGDSDSVQVGDTVLAIGSPLGLQGSVTAGIVSGLHRTITTRDRPRSQFDTGATNTIGDVIQTDAPINSGNSGGALVNMRGEVIGINTAIATAGSTGNIGVGFAISSNRARAVAEALIAGQEIKYPFLGVQIEDAPTGGARIVSVVEGGAADQAGLRAGDVVMKWGDRPIRGVEALIGAIQSSSVGDQVPVTILRDGDEQVVTVTVGEQE